MDQGAPPTLSATDQENSEALAISEVVIENPSDVDGPPPETKDEPKEIANPFHPKAGKNAHVHDALHKFKRSASKAKLKLTPFQRFKIHATAVLTFACVIFFCRDPLDGKAG